MSREKQLTTRAGFVTRCRDIVLAVWCRRIVARSIGRSGSLGRLTLQFTDAFFHLLARLESHHKLFWHKDFLTGAWVASLASGPLLDLENAEVPQFNAFILHQRLHDGVESFLDDFLCLQ